MNHLIPLNHLSAIHYVYPPYHGSTDSNINTEAPNPNTQLDLLKELR
jgi:hypothetical protein